MNSDTTGGKLLTSEPTVRLRLSSWSPDGERIAFFAARFEDSAILDKYPLPLHLPLYVMDASGKNQRRLFDFPVSWFSWSPDGRKLLYVSAYEDPQRGDRAVLTAKRSPMSAIYLLDLRTGQRRRLSGFGLNCFGAWSPDGARLALSLGDERSCDLYVATLDGKRSKKLTDSDGIRIKPAWSPDGGRIAYIAVDDSADDSTPPSSGAWILDVRTGKKERVGDRSVYEVAWSPDAASLLLQSVDAIALVSLRTGKSVRLTHGQVVPLDATFTPDGREVMFRSEHEGSWHLYAVDLNGNNVRRLTGKLSAAAYCLSPLRN